jgi:thioredoxin reductase (NADPH)
MSDSLIRQIDATASITVRPATRVVGGCGDTRLTGLIVEGDHGRREEVSAAALFVLIGAEPGTGWLSSVVRAGGRGFLLTDRDIPAQSWSLDRPLFPFEASRPGVFAVGDVRFGSVKRVASAVGE